MAQLAQRPPPVPGDHSSRVAIETAAHGGGRLTAVVSAIALLFSGYSLWDSSLKGPDLKVFVPPVIQYSSPYQNSNFEVVAVPVTIINDGGRTGAVLSMTLEATSAKGGPTKKFYAADFGRWTMEKTRANAYEPFAPISLAGKASRTETALFYPKSPEEKPDQLITEPGVYKFKLILDEASSSGPLDRVTSRKPVEASFDMELRIWDARAFQNGTIPMYSTTGRSVASGSSAP
ncbi:MAG: hypothetical protein ACKVP4_05100 [Hyphomicrobium sp.]